MQITYKSIEHLIVETTQNGDLLKCVFSDPKSPEPLIESSISISGIVSAKSRMKTSLFREIRNTISSFLSQFLRQIFGQWAGDSLSRVSDQGLRPNYSEVNLVREDKRKAIILAFEKISNQFAYDQSAQKFERIK